MYSIKGTICLCQQTNTSNLQKQEEEREDLRKKINDAVKNKDRDDGLTDIQMIVEEEVLSCMSEEEAAQKIKKM
uniref:Uncharacterized protein n=1 Tax=Ditylenchus dipsaci TaxID=166011 RepID=A0A915EH67_9BILA